MRLVSSFLEIFQFHLHNSMDNTLTIALEYTYVHRLHNTGFHVDALLYYK